MPEGIGSVTAEEVAREPGPGGPGGHRRLVTHPHRLPIEASRLFPFG